MANTPAGTLAAIHPPRPRLVVAFARRGWDRSARTHATHVTQLARSLLVVAGGGLCGWVLINTSSSIATSSRCPPAHRDLLHPPPAMPSAFALAVRLWDCVRARVSRTQWPSTTSVALCCTAQLKALTRYQHAHTPICYCRKVSRENYDQAIEAIYSAAKEKPVGCLRALAAALLPPSSPVFTRSLHGGQQLTHRPPLTRPLPTSRRSRDIAAEVRGDD
jgi:hypothetical protein